MENLQETVKRQEGIILSLNQTLESTKSSYNALFEENVIISIFNCCKRLFKIRKIKTSHDFN